MKKLRMFSVIGMVLVLLMTAVPVFAADPVPGKGNTDVIVVNTNQNTGAANADTTALYYNPSGVVEYSRPQGIASRGSFNFQASQTPLGDDWEGSMIVQSDTEMAALAEITWTEGNSPDGTTAGAYLGYAFGSTQMYLPFVVYAPNAQFTRISVQNTEDAVATIQMQYVDRDGNLIPGFTITDSIDGLGSKTYDTHIPGPKIPNWNNSPYFNTNGQWTGALKITSTNNKEIAAVATNHWQRWAVAYNGSSSGDTKNYLPSVERRCTSCVEGGGVWQGFSVIIAQCLEPSSSCNVQVQYVNKDTGAVDLTLSRSLNPGAALGANTRNGGDFNFGDYSVLGGAWAGSAIVRTTNNTDVSVIAYTIRPGTLLAGSTSGSSASDGGTETFLPSVYQRGPSCPTGTPPAFDIFSLIRIQNPTTTAASDVDIYYFNRNGSLQFQENNFSIAGEKSLNRNTRVDCQAIPLGLNWEGSVYITANQPVVAVAETLWGATKMNAYNGYSITR